MIHTVVALALVAAVAAPSTTDPLERGLETAFATLLDNDDPSLRRAHTQARRSLERCVEVFDDVDVDGSALERAYASDPKKPYRGRPHEQLAAHLTLAALDLERGRADLALPSLRTARLIATRRDVKDAVVVVDALAYVALRAEHSAGRATAAEVAAARVDVPAAVAAAVDAADGDRVVALRLRGFAPTLVSAGSAGESVTLVPNTAARRPHAIALARGVDVDADAVTVVAAFAAAAAAGLTKARAFDATLADRAQQKARAQSEAQRAWQDSQRAAQTGHAGGLAAAALFGVMGAGRVTEAAVVDARADVRVVDTAPAFVELVVKDPARAKIATSRAAKKAKPARTTPAPSAKKG
jgi:hypothetical protein